MNLSHRPKSRAATFSFGLLLAIHALFFISFLLTAGLTTARAEGAVCTGKDLLAALEVENPAKLEAIRAEAAQTPNGRGLLWRVEKPGVEPSYLFGTMHMTDPRVTALAPQAQQAFDAAERLVIETTDVLDEKRMLAALAANPELTMFTDGTTLSSLLSPEDAQVLAEGLQARGIPPLSVAKMKPWILASLVSMPACELNRKASGLPMLDVKLAQDAQAAGKPVQGLETAADQLGAMASLPIDFHMNGLVDTLKLGGRIEDVIETMIVLYEEGETSLFWPLFRAEFPQSDDGGYAAFEETMITRRNHTMAERALPILEGGDAFVAVGALHLPGEDGLVTLLREHGFTVTLAE
ncbi:MAG TPA: TraB/GumN family protein [Mesorhizobium sp.]|jgi:hypothetical protein|nr:TraB/GumN family protein [Mesorhizobium sp.]